MKKLGLTDQRIVTIGKQLIRSRIIQTQAIFAQDSGKPRKEWTTDQEQHLRKLAKRKRSSTGFSDDDNQLVGFRNLPFGCSSAGRGTSGNLC